MKILKFNVNNKKNIEYIFTNNNNNNIIIIIIIIIVGTGRLMSP